MPDPRLSTPLLLLLVMSCQAVEPSGTSAAKPHQMLARRDAKRPVPPVLVKLPNGHYRVKRPWHLEFGGHAYSIPAGYSSNGITAPARIKAALGDGVEHPETWSAVFHDWLFTQKGNNRAVADRQFHELLIAYGVAPEKARLMYTTVSAYSFSKNFD